jgi:glycolate oxidase iron-sulfur subunit
MAMTELLPLYDLIAKCNRCGFCQAGCPVYRVTGSEHSLARGRWAVARGLVLGEIELTPETVQALDDCLLCRGCTAHCFPALKTDEVVTAIRQAYLSRYGQPVLQRTVFRQVLSDSQRLEWAGRLAVWGKRSGLADLAYRTGLLGLVDKRLAVASRVVESMPEKIFRRGTDGRNSPANPRYRVGYFVSCGFSFQYPEVAEATLRVLAQNGCAVTVLNNTCCGRPAHAYGDLEATREIARKSPLHESHTTVTPSPP